MGEYYYRKRIINGKEYLVREDKAKARKRANERYKLKTEELKKKSLQRYALKKDDINYRLKQKRIELKPTKYCKMCGDLILKSKKVDCIYCSVKCNSRNN